jgi:hypothetical protein
MKRPLSLHIYPHLALCVRSPALIPKTPATCFLLFSPTGRDGHGSASEGKGVLWERNKVRAVEFCQNNLLTD